MNIIENRRISIAIPQYNNSEFLKDLLSPILGDERIDDIVMVDDNSQDYGKTCSIVWQLDAINKVKIYRNPKRYGSLKNKLEAVKKCKNEWVILLDSDNVIDKDYIDKIFAIKSWEDDTIYSPDFARPHLDYRKYSGYTFDKTSIKPYLNQSELLPCLNNCNYFLNKNQYVSNIMDYRDTNIIGVDTFYLNTIWLLSGNRLHIVKGMEYFHRMHPNGTYVRSDGDKLEIYTKRLMNTLKQEEAIPKSFGIDFYIEWMFRKYVVKPGKKIFKKICELIKL